MVAVGLAGLVAVVLAGLNERRRELAILRSVGARPGDIFALLMVEGVLVIGVGIVLGLVLLAAVFTVVTPWVQARFGLVLGGALPAAAEWPLIAAVFAAGILASAVPAWRAYRLSLADGLTPRV